MCITIHRWQKTENGANKAWKVRAGRVCGPWGLVLCWSELWSQLKGSWRTLWPFCLRSKAIVWFPHLHWIWNLAHLLSHLEPKRQQQKMLQPYAQTWILCQDSNHIFISSPMPIKYQETLHPFSWEQRKEMVWEPCLVCFLLALTWPTPIPWI